MPSRVTTVFACQSCGSASPKWLGRCPECGEWNSYVEEIRGPKTSTAGEEEAVAAPIADVAEAGDVRVETGMPGLDRVLGGGIVAGSVVLIGGEPGIGKSTFLLQVARAVAARAGEVLYATAEESAAQVRLRGERLRVERGGPPPDGGNGHRPHRRRGRAPRAGPPHRGLDPGGAQRGAHFRRRDGLAGAGVRRRTSSLREVARCSGRAHRPRHERRQSRRPEVARAPRRYRRDARGRPRLRCGACSAPRRTGSGRWTSSPSTT